MITNLFTFEHDKNAHPTAVDTNPFDVTDFGRGRALVADAGGNDLIKVERFGQAKLVAVLPDELVSTDNIRSRAARRAARFLATPADDPAQPVATSAAIGPDGWIYAGELKGFRRRPEGPGSGRSAECGERPLRQGAGEVLGRARTASPSVIDLAFGGWTASSHVLKLHDASSAAGS